MIEKYINVVLTEKEMNTIEQIAEAQDLTVSMVLRLIFDRGLQETIEEAIV